MKPKSKPNKQTQTYAFIDSQNLNVGTQKFGWKMNWARFRKWLEEEHGVTKAYMFIGYIPENESLYEQMHDAGYMVVLKPTFDITQPRTDEDVPEEEKKPVKGNIDADLVLWAMKEMSNYKKAVIVSGDGDFYSLVEYLEAKGRLEVLLTPSSHYSRLYSQYEKYIVNLDDHRKTLAYHDRKRRNKPARS